MKAAGIALVLLPMTVGLVTLQGDPLDNIVRAEMSRQRIPGVAVAVVRGGQIIKAQGYGLANVEHDVPVTDETIFQSGSLGKQFTAAVVMLLVEDGTVGTLGSADEVFSAGTGGLAAHHGPASPDAHLRYP